MFLMVEKGTRGGKCHATYQYAKAKYKPMNDYDKNKVLSYFKHLDVNNSYGWVMSRWF